MFGVFLRFIPFIIDYTNNDLRCLGSLQVCKGLSGVFGAFGGVECLGSFGVFWGALGLRRSSPDVLRKRSERLGFGASGFAVGVDAEFKTRQPCSMGGLVNPKP